MPRPKLGQRDLSGAYVAGREPFHLVVRKTGKSKRQYGPYTDEETALLDAKLEELGEVASWQAVLMLNGGYSKNPETGATSILSWYGELRKVFVFMAPILESRKAPSSQDGQPAKRVE